MLRRLTLLGLACAALAVPASASASSDTATTEAYLRANYQLVKVAHAHLATSIAGYHSVLRQVRSQCPKAALKSPQDPESTELSNEVIGAMVLNAGKPDLAAIKTFLHAVSGMRWGNGSIDRAISSYVSSLRKLYRLSPPNLCGDIASWATTGFSALPASKLSFDRVFYPNWVALGLIPPGMAHDENGASQQLARGSAAFEFVLTNAEADAVETWGEIMNELELNP
jgi:hypothetical protein